LSWFVAAGVDPEGQVGIGVVEELVLVLGVPGEEQAVRMPGGG
jgi:hypothetical protein